MYISSEIATRIKQTAKKRGVSVKKLLADVGLGFNTMSNMKTSMIMADSLAKIADYLNCSVDYLLGRTENITHAENTLAPLEILFKRINEIGLNFAIVSRETKISVDKLFSWDEGKSTPSGRELKILCDYLDFPFEYAVGLKPQQEIDEFIFSYKKLDAVDKAEIRGEIKQMLKADKYQPFLSTSPSSSELAAWGGDDNEGTLPYPTGEDN